MRKLLLALVVTVGVVQLAAAEELYFPRDFRVCKTRTTEIDRLVLPDLANRDEAVKKYGEPVELKIDQWQGGVSFTDGANRTWYPIRGAMAKEKPEKIVGWLLRSDFGRGYFFSEQGTLFGPDAPHQVRRSPDANLVRAIQSLEQAIEKAMEKSR